MRNYKRVLGYDFRLVGDELGDEVKMFFAKISQKKLPKRRLMERILKKTGRLLMGRRFRGKVPKVIMNLFERKLK